MTKKEAIAKIMESGDWREQDAISIVENEIKKNPDYLEEVKLVDVEKDQKKYKEPKQGQKKLKWKGIPVHSGSNTAKDLGGLGKKFEEAANIAFGGKKTVEQPTAGELLEDIEGGSKFDPLSSEFDDDAWFEDYSYLNGEEPKEQTQEERLERQIEHFNNMRSHVSDLDEDYLLDDAPRDHWEQGLQSRPDEREMTQIVEALQRKAMQQGNVDATTQLPIGQFSNQGFPMTPAGPNPIIQALQNRMGRPGSDVNSLYDPYNARQTLQYGGGQQGYAHPGIRGGPSRFGGGGSNTPSYL